MKQTKNQITYSFAGQKLTVNSEYILTVNSEYIAY